MQFQRLRLAGFKSFVDPAELVIEPGLTGVVGPNGCGKSNLLEALRWVMGANSAKAMRAGGMDDVIFAGAAGRPPRSHAETTLTIDNADGHAPAPFQDTPVLQVSRRIDRGAGSTYRINGREVRARDVQLLFADAGTGANSPALVRQGQISELISAKPQNRRRILEEAAGVGGLHARRHEAELRLRGAETNLERLDDVLREVEAAHGRLRREARQAERHRRLSGDIQALQAALLYARWDEARTALEAAEAEARAAGAAVELGARAAAAALVALEGAEAALPARREEAQIAQALANRAVLELDRAERDAAAATAELTRAREALSRAQGEAAREREAAAEAQAAVARLTPEAEALRREVEQAPERLPALEAAQAAAESRRAAADAALESAAAAAAARTAERAGAIRRRDETAAALRRAAEQRAAAEREAARLAASAPAASDAPARLAAAQAALEAARARLATAEEAREAARTAEHGARDAARTAEDLIGRLRAEARGLAQVVAAGAGKGGPRHPPVLDQIVAAPGLEAALAAALGDELDASLDAGAVARWAGAETPPVAWPEGCTPLAAEVQAPEALTARLAFVAVAAQGDGARLQGRLLPGQRLVSREGHLWRWDGLTVRADAPRPAAVRLERRNRLRQVEAALEARAPELEAAVAARSAAAAALATAEAEAKGARAALPELERRLAEAQRAADAEAREAARREAQAQAQAELLARLLTAEAEARGAAEAAEQALAALPAVDGRESMDAARAEAALARESAAEARAAAEAERRERDGRRQRLERLAAELAQWTRRAEAAVRRAETLEGEQGAADAAVAAALQAPEALEARRAAAADDLAVEERRRTAAADALQEADSGRGGAERTLRQAEFEAARAREAAAAAGARLDAARDRLSETAAAVRDGARTEPEALGRALNADGLAGPIDAAQSERRLMQLEAERAALGAVNLRADAEARELAGRLETMNAERADLTGAIARLREGVEALNAEGRERLLAAFTVIDGHFQSLFQSLFGGGAAELRLVESPDPLEAGLEIYACPPGKRLSAMSLMSGGEQALTAAALIFGVFLANPSPLCVLDEVDAPLDDANVDRFCTLLDEMRTRTSTRFLCITHNPVTMSRMDRLFGVTMAEQGVSQLVSVDLRQAERLAAA